MTKSVTEQINDILEEYGSELNTTVREVTADIAKNVAKDLKKTSPKSKGRGSAKGGKHYANGWTAGTENIPGGGARALVYNKYAWQLTHLLEKGHMIANQYGTYGRAPAYPHIAPAEERGINEYLNELEKKL